MCKFSTKTTLALNNIQVRVYPSQSDNFDRWSVKTAHGAVSPDLLWSKSYCSRLGLVRSSSSSSVCYCVLRRNLSIRWEAWLCFVFINYYTSLRIRIIMSSSSLGPYNSYLRQQQCCGALLDTLWQAFFVFSSFFLS